MRLRAQLKSVPNEPVRSPQIRSPDLSEMRQFPGTSDSSRDSADRLGHQRRKGCRKSSTTPGNERGGLAYVFQVVGQEPQAAMRDVDRIAGSPEVHLADIAIDWESNSSYRALATYNLEPAGLSEVRLTLPPRAVLVQAFVAKSRPRRNGSGTMSGAAAEIRTMAATNRSPLHGSAAATRRRRRPDISAPSLAGLPIARTLWTIQGPEEWGQGRPQLAHALVDEAEQLRIRLQTVQSLLDSAPIGMAKSSLSEAEIWHDIWRGFSSQYERQLALLQAVGSSREESTPRELFLRPALIDRRHFAVAYLPPPTAAILWRYAAHACAFPNITLVYSPQRQPHEASWLQAFGLAGVIALGFVLRRATLSAKLPREVALRTRRRQRASSGGYCWFRASSDWRSCSFAVSLRSAPPRPRRVTEVALRKSDSSLGIG